MRMIGFWQRALCVLMLTLPVLASAQTAPVTVFAAASLKESMDEAATAYEKATGTPVRVSYAASSALARQIEQGAPADVFFSADLEWMDYLQQHGLVLPAQLTACSAIRWCWLRRRAASCAWIHARPAPSPRRLARTGAWPLVRPPACRPVNTPPLRCASSANGIASATVLPNRKVCARH